MARRTVDRPVDRQQRLIDTDADRYRPVSSHLTVLVVIALQLQLQVRPNNSNSHDTSTSMLPLPLPLLLPFNGYFSR